ncbi:MAG: ADP-glyceromanno-heptose 6-epimerase [Elusimicrobia bacterium]|nr:ADP-glyceromanno-heptose 6-epimerase [Elusimicrobiota bacterium]
MRYLVTGGAGFIGSNLSWKLQQQGHTVTVLDDFSSGSFKNLVGFGGDIVPVSICERERLFAVKGRFDGIFHEAAITDTTVHDQRRMMEVNVEGFRNILDFALARGVKRVVYASSAGTYGNGVCPMTETATPTPENVYGFSKAIMDNVARAFAASQKKVKVCGLRYFNVYGPREYYKGSAASMVYQLYLQMAAGKKPRVFTAGEQQRDFIYVKDVVRANLLAMQKGRSGGVYNVGTGRPEDFNRMIACLNASMKLKLETEYFANPYSFFQNKTHADMALSKKELGFEAEYDLARGIEDYVKKLAALRR